MQEVLTRQSSLLEGKVVIDPSNPLGFDADGQITRNLPADQSQASIVAGLLPASAHYAKHSGRSAPKHSLELQTINRAGRSSSTPPTTRPPRRRSSA
jgi:hypothetical protein